MRIIDRAGRKKDDLDLSEGKLKEIGSWCRNTRERSDTARNAIEREWMEDLRQYSGVPMLAERNVPIDNAPNLEITLGAMHVEGIFANWIELAMQTSQVLVAIPRKGYEEYQDAVQDLIDWGCREAFNLRRAINAGPFDCIQLGSMALYVPYSEKIRVTNIAKVIDRGPRIVPIPIEDFHLPEGSMGDIQTDAWCEMDMWLYPSDLRMYEQKNRWDVGDNLSRLMRAPNISEVRQRRLDVSREQSSAAASGDLYRVAYRCGEYDIDEDGINEELEIFWDVISGNVLKVNFPDCQIRPFEFGVYQQRNYVAWGLGVQRMVSPFEEEVTVIHNERTLNMRLANSRIWKATQTIAPFLDRVWPGKVIRVSRTDEFSGEKMGDIYPSSTEAEMITVGYAEKRSGISDVQTAAARMGTRTPATSVMSYQQSANRRFTPSFNNMRDCMAAAVRQCLYRYQERVRASDKAVINDLMNVLGTEKGSTVIRLFQSVDNLIDAMDVQMTAVSISINREADRQSFASLLQVWEAFQEKRMQLLTSANMSPIPEVKQLAEEIDKAAIRLFRKYLRTFEQISDVDAYLAEVKNQQQQMPPELMNGLQGLISMMNQTQGGQPSGAPATSPPPEPEQQAA